MLLREFSRRAEHGGLNPSLPNKADALDTSYTQVKKLKKKKQINILQGPWVNTLLSLVSRSIIFCA